MTRDHADRERGSRAAGQLQVLRLLSLVLLIVLALAGLRGAVAAPRWNGPLRGDGVAVGLALEVVLGALLLITVRRDRSQRGDGGEPGTGEAADAAPDVPGRLRAVLKFVLVVGVIATAVLILVFAHLHLPRGRTGAGSLPTPQPRPSLRLNHAPPGNFRLPLGPILYALLIVALVAAIAVSVWLSRRLRQAAPAKFDDDTEEDSAGLRDAVESGRVALLSLDDARAAIIACYVAMERRLADRGTAREAADTPDELLARAIATGIVRGRAARRLTRLFYEARFSSHPLGREQRDAAERALDELAAELRQPETAAAQPGGGLRGAAPPGPQGASS